MEVLYQSVLSYEIITCSMYMRRKRLKKLVKDKNVAFIVDELSDDEGRYVLDVMAVILDFDELSPQGNCVTYLLDTHFLTKTNNKTVFRTKWQKKGTGNGNDVLPMGQKKGNESGGKLSRSSIKGFFSAKSVNDIKDRNSTPKVSRHDSEPVVNYRLDQNIASKFNMLETTCCFPEHKQPLLDCLLYGTIKVNGDNIGDGKDVEALLGCQTRDEDNYLNNFVIDWYLKILARNVSTESKVECIELEKFEKGIVTGKPAATKKGAEGKGFNFGPRHSSCTMQSRQE